MKLGIVVREDHSGLGYQTRALVEMLNPEKTLVIKSGADVPSFKEYEEFLTGLDAMITCETPYIYEAWNWARLMGVRTFCQPNWELFDGLVQPNMPHPDQYLIPSFWHLEDFQSMYPNAIYLPPPTLDMPRSTHAGKPRFSHIVGAGAVYDRNGWALLREALQYTKSDFELVVFSQVPITGLHDPRVTYNIFDVEYNSDMYRDFDGLILPRRYGGLCLPMNESLMSGVPVMMTDVDPNWKILPKDWLLPSYVGATFDGRSTIDVYSVEPQDLARKIDQWCAQLPDKDLAYKTGHDNYSMDVLRPQYEKLLTEYSNKA